MLGVLQGAHLTEDRFDSWELTVPLTLGSSDVVGSVSYAEAQTSLDQANAVKCQILVR